MWGSFEACVEQLPLREGALGGRCLALCLWAAWSASSWAPDPPGLGRTRGALAAIPITPTLGPRPSPGLPLEVAAVSSFAPLRAEVLSNYVYCPRFNRDP